MKCSLNGYMGCGLDDFEKNHEQRQDNLKFYKHFDEKAWAFFKRFKFQKYLVQPIRDYIDMINEDYMKTLRLMDWM